MTIVLRHSEALELNLIEYQGAVSLGELHALAAFVTERPEHMQRDGLTVLLVEQNASAALAIADRAYVLETGKVTVSGTAAEIRVDRRVCEAYLGV